MDDAAEFLDALAKPGQFLFADLVMFRVAGLGVGFLQFLEHRALAAIGLGPDAVKASVETFGERAKEGDIMVIWRVIGQGEQQAGLKPLGCLMKSKRGVFQ